MAVVLDAEDPKGGNWVTDAFAMRGGPPPAAATLGWELVAADSAAGTIEVTFEAVDAFLNSAGTVQGGFLAAMLDATLGPALIATISPEQYAPTLELKVQYLRPAHPGRLVGHGRVMRRGKDIAFLTGELVDSEDTVLAAATATAQIRDR